MPFCLDLLKSSIFLATIIGTKSFTIAVSRNVSIPSRRSHTSGSVASSSCLSIKLSRVSCSVRESGAMCGLSSCVGVSCSADIRLVIISIKNFLEKHVKQLVSLPGFVFSDIY